MAADLAIYGAGGLGREFALMVEQINHADRLWNFIGFFDDAKKKNDTVDGLPILGSLHDLNMLQKNLSLVVAIADPLTRKTLVNSITSDHIRFPVLVHPGAITGSRANRFGHGTVITAGCILTTNISLGAFSIVNLSCTIGHDVTTGDFVSVMPGCSISGNVSIGEGTLLGTGSRILQNLEVGGWCKVGAGAVLTRNFGNGQTVVGVPAYTINEK